MALEPERAVPSPLRLLGLDVGDRRVGVAVSDPTGALATPLTVYHRRGTVRDMEYLLRLASELEVSAIVVGLPKNMNGTEGPQAEKTRDFARELEARGLRAILWDERLSTVEAVRRMQERGRRGRAIREKIDAEAAALILETYLDHLRMKGAS